MVLQRGWEHYPILSIVTTKSQKIAIQRISRLVINRPFQIMGVEPIRGPFEWACTTIMLYLSSHQEASNGSMPLPTCLFALTNWCQLKDSNLRTPCVLQQFFFNLSVCHRLAFQGLWAAAR